MANRYLRCHEVGSKISVCESTVWLYTRQGKLKAIKLSPKVTVWSESDVDEFVQSQINALNEPEARVKTA